QAAEHRNHRDDRRQVAVPVDDAYRLLRAGAERQHDGNDREEPEGPENRPEQHAAAQRSHSGGASRIRYPKPRTVSIDDAPSLRRNRATNTSTVLESRSASRA